MSGIESLDKVVQEKIADEFQGFSFDQNGIYINLDNDYPLMYKKGAQLLTADNLYFDLVDPLRESAKETASGDEEEFLKAMVSLLNKEVNSFFEKRFESFRKTVEEFVESQERVLNVYENRNMFDFLSDKGFQKSLNTKETDINEFISNYLGKKTAIDDSDRTTFILKIENIRERFIEVKVLFFDFQKLLKLFMELTTMVKKSQASEDNKAIIMNNLKLLQEINTDQMKRVNVAKFSPDLQAQLFQKEFSVNELVDSLN